MTETGLAKNQVRRFVTLQVLKTVKGGQITRESLDALKEKYVLPPPSQEPQKIPRDDPKTIRINNVMRVTGMTGPEAQGHLRELRLPTNLEQAYVDRIVQESDGGRVTLDVVRCSCGNFVMTPVGATDLKCPKCAYTRSRSVG